MGHIITELDLLLERVLIVSKDSKSLRNIFEEMAFEMTTELNPDKNIELSSASLPEGASLSLFSAFRLGTRGPLKIRLNMLGAELSQGPLNESLWSLCDFVILDIDPEDPLTENLLRSIVSFEGKEMPCVIRGLATGESEGKRVKPELRQQALYRWIQNNFTKYHFLPKSHKILSESLEWSLSF